LEAKATAVDPQAIRRAICGFAFTEPGNALPRCRLLLRRRRRRRRVFGEHDGAIEGATWFDNGRFGKALSFDGTNDCLSVPNDPALQLTEEFTLEAWIKSRGTGAWEPILSKNDAYSIWLGEEPGHLRSYIREEDENEALAIDPNGIDENVWAHVAVTFDGQWMRLFVNGEFADKAWSEGAATTASPLSIGCSEEPHEGFFEGLIDEVRVYNRALGAGEVTRDKSNPVPIPPTAVTGEAEVFAPNEALLMGAVNPGDLETGYYFEYGPTTEYGEVAPAIEEEVVGGREDLDAEEAIAYLTPETTYHYRTVAYNRAGTAVGADQTFTTPPAEESPEEEAKKRENEQDYTAEISKLDPEFINLNFSGLGDQDRSSDGLEKLANTGAGMIRVSIEKLNTFGAEKPLYDDFILNAADNNLKILFVLGSKHIPEGSNRFTFRKRAEEIVRRYGKAHFKQKNSLWGEKRAENMGVDKIANAIDSWEIWNEPNLGLNSVKRPFPPEEGKFRSKPERELPGPVDPKEFGEFLQVMSNGIRNVEKDATVIVGGLCSVGTVRVTPDAEKEEIEGVEDEINAQQFLREMGHFSAYNAVGFHPYVFRPKKKVALGPVNDGEVEKVRVRVRGVIATLRQFLNREKVGGKDKKIWITEIGWPVDHGDEAHPSVMKGIQAKLVGKVFSTIETMGGPSQWNIANVFYYNYRDTPGSLHWDENMGLVDDELKGRSALDVFRIHAF
jgi:concanavalin A-like lectin/glucanase superfamily protein